MLGIKMRSQDNLESRMNYTRKHNVALLCTSVHSCQVESNLTDSYFQKLTVQFLNEDFFNMYSRDIYHVYSPFICYLYSYTNPGHID